MRLKNLKNWLRDCNYPDSVINQSFYNAKLQGPVLFTDNSKNIPFVTTYYENIDNEKVVRKIRSKLSKIQDTFQKYSKIKMLFFSFTQILLLL